MERINFTGKAARKVAGGLLLLATIMLTACNGSSGDGSSTTTPTPTPTPVPNASGASAVVSKILVTNDKAAGVKTGGTDEATLTITAIDKNNGVIAGALINLSTTSGVLSSSGVQTGADGKVTIKYNTGDDKNNRTESITLSGSPTVAGNTYSTAYPVKAIGSTVILSPSSTNFSSGSTTQVEALVKDGNGQTVDGAKVTFASSGAGSVTFSPTEVTTANGGKATVTVTGATAGLATITATSLGNTKTQDLTITGNSSTSFKISSPSASRIAYSTNKELTVTVNAPGSSNVVFATTNGGWPSNTTKEVNVISGTASATFKASNAGIATISVYDKAKPQQTSTLIVALTADVNTVSNVTISVQSTASVIAPSSGTQQSTTVVTATVIDKTTNQPVGNIPVSFDIPNSTGGGETLSPVVVLSSDGSDPSKPLGSAETTFTAGSLPSGQSGSSVSINATALLANGNTQTSLTPAKITIAGLAGSISIGEASKIGSSTDNTRYLMPMSVIVSDSAGNPPPVGTEVNLSVWPLYFSTGGNCSIRKTYKSEDINENLILDTGEEKDTLIEVNNSTYLMIGSASNVKNGKLDAPAAAAGTVPKVVKTEADGSAPFTYTYNKSDSIWTVVRFRATTKVQGTETVSESIFRLRSLKDESDPLKDCFIPNSKYNAIAP